jgi:hypothetical protein
MGGGQGALPTRFGPPIGVPQRCDERAVPALGLERGARLGREALGPPPGHATCSGLPHAIQLPRRPERRLDLGNRPAHVAQPASRGRAGINLWIADLEVDLLALECGRALAERQRGAGEPVQTRHHERGPVPPILQTGGSARPVAHGAARGLLKELVAVRQRVALDGEALPDRTAPCIAHACHGGLPAVSICLSPCASGRRRQALRHRKGHVSQGAPAKTRTRQSPPERKPARLPVQALPTPPQRLRLLGEEELEALYGSPRFPPDERQE